MFFRNARASVINAKKCSACQDHGPAGHTNGPACAAHDMGSSESDSSFNQSVEIGRVNVRIV